MALEPSNLLTPPSSAPSPIGGIQCSQGQDFRYWLVGDWVRGTFVD